MVPYSKERKNMPSVEKILAEMRNNAANVRFADCLKVCTAYFGEPRVRGSHHKFKTPWAGDPRINIQNRNGKVAPYQVDQVVKAVDKLEGER